METIKTYKTSDIGASQSLVTLETFIGDMDNAELADNSSVDTSEAVIATNGLILSLEQRDAEIAHLHHECERLQAAGEASATLALEAQGEVERLRAERERMWCSACGTVTRDDQCDCTRYTDTGTQKLVNYSDTLQADIQELSAENERLRAALQEIEVWSRAYPRAVFPEPDFKRAAKVLKDSGMTL